jgi:hypothetical protein
MGNEHKPSAETTKVVKNTEDLLADDRVAKYMRRQRLLVKLVKTKLWKLLFGKRLFMHEDIFKQQDELFSNLCGDKLDKVDSRYIDSIFLSYSKRKNKSKSPDDLCMKKMYDFTGKKLQKNNFDITAMQIRVDDNPKAKEEEQIFMSMPEYLNLLENIRVQFKKINAEYEIKAKNELQTIDDDEIFTDYQAHSQADNIRTKKIEICGKTYDYLMKSADIDVNFPDLCDIFYLAFKWSKNLDSLKKILEHDITSELFIDDIFLKHIDAWNIQKNSITLEHLIMVFEKLLKENTSHIPLRNMYDIS